MNSKVLNNMFARTNNEMEAWNSSTTAKGHTQFLIANTAAIKD